MVKKIIRFPIPSLRFRCRPIDWPLYRSDLIDHIQDLKDTLNATPNGLALASNQILSSGWRVFVVRRPSDLPEVVINPTYIPADDETLISDEGCLSIPETSVRVPRYSSIEMVFHDIDGSPRVQRYSGLLARVAQHEIDHLDGKLIYDYADKRTQVLVRQMAIRNRKAGR